MARRSLFESLITLPWWICLGLASAVFISLRHIIPAIKYDNSVLQGIATNAAPQVAIPITLLLVLAAGVSAFTASRKRRLLDAQTSLDSVQRLSWQCFEELIGEIFRRQGYQVTETGGGGPDGGIDLVLRKEGERILVQCKRRRNSKVSVRDVREFYGVIMAEHAAGGILATAGTFTKPAREFADGKPLELIPGYQLAQMIQSVQKVPDVLEHRLAEADSKITQEPSTPSCPICGSIMMLRTARKGQNAGLQFWGCSQFPKCKGTRQS